MAIGGGKDLRMAASYEVTWGQAGANFRSIGMLQGEPAFSADNQLVPIYGGGMINARHIKSGPFVCGGRFDYFMQDNFMATLSIGDWDSTSPVTNTNNYIKKGVTQDTTDTETAPVEYEVNGYTVRYGDFGGVKNITAVGCKTNSITYTLALNEPIRASVEYYAKEIYSDGNVQALTALEDQPFMYFNGGILNFNSSRQATVTNLTITVNNNLKRDLHGVTNDRLTQAILQGDRNITGNITFNYDQDDTNMETYLGSGTGLRSGVTTSGTVASSGTSVFDVDCTLQNEAGSTTADYRALKFSLGNLQLGTLERTYPIDGSVVSETYSFTAESLTIDWYDDNNANFW